jgi:hypothetical protein
LATGRIFDVAQAEARIRVSIGFIWAKKNQEFFGGEPEALYVTRLKKEPPDKPAEKV